VFKCNVSYVMYYWRVISSAHQYDDQEDSIARGDSERCHCHNHVSSDDVKTCEKLFLTGQLCDSQPKESDQPVQKGLPECNAPSCFEIEWSPAPVVGECEQSAMSPRLAPRAVD
jgi:hypothetical protein